MCLSTGGRAWREACVAWGAVWWGVCMAGGPAWQGACVPVGDVHGKGEGHARRGPTHHPSGRYYGYGYGIRSLSGRYTSYWNAFLLYLLIPISQGKPLFKHMVYSDSDSLDNSHKRSRAEYELMAYFHCRTQIWIWTRTQIPLLCRYCGKGIQIRIWVNGNMSCIILCSHWVWNPNLSLNLNPSPAAEISPKRCVHLPRTPREVLRRKRWFADWCSAPGFLRFCPQSRWWWNPSEWWIPVSLPVCPTS